MDQTKSVVVSVPRRVGQQSGRGVVLVSPVRFLTLKAGRNFRKCELYANANDCYLICVADEDAFSIYATLFRCAVGERRKGRARLQAVYAPKD
jgi:hypothetical protein